MIPSLRRWLKRFSAIEPVIGNMKTDGRLGRNYLLRVEGDKVNAILCGAGHNIRKLLKAFLIVVSFLETVQNPIYTDGLIKYS